MTSSPLNSETWNRHSCAETQPDAHRGLWARGVCTTVADFPHPKSHSYKPLLSPYSSLNPFSGIPSDPMLSSAQDPTSSLPTSSHDDSGPQSASLMPHTMPRPLYTTPIHPTIPSESSAIGELLHAPAPCGGEKGLFDSDRHMIGGSYKTDEQMWKTLGETSGKPK